MFGRFSHSRTTTLDVFLSLLFLLFVSFAILLSHSSAFVVVVAVDIFAHFEHGQFQFYFGLTPSDTVL